LIRNLKSEISDLKSAIHNDRLSPPDRLQLRRRVVVITGEARPGAILLLMAEQFAVPSDGVLIEHAAGDPPDHPSHRTKAKHGRQSAPERFFDGIVCDKAEKNGDGERKESECRPAQSGHRVLSSRLVRLVFNGKPSATVEKKVMGVLA
jgi:hypothetical protein